MLKKYYLGRFFWVPILVKWYQNMSGSPVLRVKNQQSQVIGKKSHFEDNAHKYPKNMVFWIFQKKYSIV